MSKKQTKKAQPDQKENCEKCRFSTFLSADGGMGFCRFDPPALVLGNIPFPSPIQVKSFYPSVGRLDWCGKFQPKQ